MRQMCLLHILFVCTQKQFSFFLFFFSKSRAYTTCLSVGWILRKTISIFYNQLCGQAYNNECITESWLLFLIEYVKCSTAVMCWVALHAFLFIIGNTKLSIMSILSSRYFDHVLPGGLWHIGKQLHGLNSAPHSSFTPGQIDGLTAHRSPTLQPSLRSYLATGSLKMTHVQVAGDTLTHLSKLGPALAPLSNPLSCSEPPWPPGHMRSRYGRPPTWITAAPCLLSAGAEWLGDGGGGHWGHLGNTSW